MALILKADKSTTNIPKVIETKNSIVLYGQCYNKHNLIPVPSEFFIVNGTKTLLNTNKKMNPKATANQCEIWNEDTIIADEYEPNMFYSLIYTAANRCALYKCREIQNRVDLLSTNSSSYNLNNIRYLGQSKEYLYYIIPQFSRVSIQGYSGTQLCSLLYIYKISKETLVLTLIGQVPYFNTATAYSIPNHIKILEDEDYIYYGVFNNLAVYSGATFKLTYTYLNIYRIVKSNSSIEEIKINTTPINTNTPINQTNICNFFANKDVFEVSTGVIGFYLMNLFDKAAPLKLIKLNTNETILNNMLSIENVAFTWNDEIKQSLSAFPTGAFYSYETFITKTNNKSYISIIMYQNADQYVTEQIVNQGIYTFEIIDFNNLKLTDYNRISDSVLKGYLISKDRSFLIVSSANNTIFMKFDTEKGCFKITSIIEYVPLSIGLDLSERVWIMKADNEVDVYSMSNPTDFNMKFEKDYYDYVGTNIETFITVEAKNFLGEYININVELSIDGNAKFKDNSSSVIKITTPSDGELNIPVIITGSNQITVYPKILTEGENN